MCFAWGGLAHRKRGHREERSDVLETVTAKLLRVLSAELAISGRFVIEGVCVLPRGIATPVCGLVRNDRYFGVRNDQESGHWEWLCDLGSHAGCDLRGCASPRGIATPVCGLVRNDRDFWDSQ